WIPRFAKAIAAYRQYTGGATSVTDELLTPKPGEFLSILIILAVAIVCWRSRRASIDSDPFLWTTIFVLAATVLIVPKTASYNQLLLLPALMLAAQWRGKLWRGSPPVRMGALLSIALVAWPWLATLALLLASLFLPEKSIERAWTLPLYTSLAIP